jgi:methionyl-tRNA formyltransferase
VGEITDEIRAIWDDMIDTMEAMPGVGLAAPQIGVMLRLAVVDCSTERGKAVRMADPEILSAGPGSFEWEEGSPNLPGVSAKITRPNPVVIAFTDTYGIRVQQTFDRSLGDLGPAPDRPPERHDLRRPPVQDEARHAAAQGAQEDLMRIVFMGTPDFSVPVLDALVDAGHEIACVYCQPPRPAGRGKKDRPSPVQVRAKALGLPVRHPVSLKSPEAQADFAALDADVGVVVAYGLILPQAVLDAPRHACLNIHASLLPRWRGAAPIQRAIMAGDAETGVCIMQMEAGLDTGPVLLRHALPIGAEETAGELHDRLSALGASAIVEALHDLPSLTPEPQPEEGVTYAHKIDKAEAAIDWSGDAEEIGRTIRGLSPFPGAWTMAGGKRVKLLRVRAVDGSGAPGTVLDGAKIACGAGAVELIEVQPEGKSPMSAEEWLRGARLSPGTRLGDAS